MGAPISLQSNYAGMVQDAPRDELPAGSLWNSVDWVPQRIGAPLQKRGGWRYASPLLEGDDTDPAYLLGLVRTPAYGNGAYNVAITDDGELYTFTDSGMMDEGPAVVVAQNPVVHRSGSDWVVVIPAADGSTGPMQFTDSGSPPSALSGTAPTGAYAAVWNDRTLLGNSAASPGRLWFGPIGDATGAWDADSWVDFNLPITGIGVTRNAILIYHAGTTSRLRGTAPPRTSKGAEDVTAVGDLIEDTPFPGDSAVGCIDARSICHWNEQVIWADSKGVYMSDGVAIENLTAKGGMSTYWKGLLPNYTPDWIICAGVQRDVLMVSLVDDDQAEVDFLCYDLERGIWYRFSNMAGTCFEAIPGTDKTYMGRSTEPKIISLETVVLAQNPTDDDDTPVAPMFETAFYRGFTRLHRRWVPSLAPQQWLRVYFNYELATDEGSTPTIAVSYSTDALDSNETTYTALSRLLDVSALTSRVRMPLRFRSRGVAFKVQQTGASLDTLWRAIEAEYYPVESGRLDSSGATAPVPPAPPAKAMLSDGTAADAWAEFDLGADRSDFWTTFTFYLPAEDLAAWEFSSPNLLALYAAGHAALNESVYISAGPKWTTLSGGAGGTPVADTSLLCEFHWVTSGTVEFYVAGTLVSSGPELNGVDTRFVRLGQDTVVPTSPSLAYHMSVKIGPARGSGSYFSDDFSSGDLSAWTSTSGSVSVVDNPAL